MTSTQKNALDLFRTDEKKYGEKFHDHLLEQYKLYVEMTDRVSARRALANTFFLTANTALLSFLAAGGASGYLGSTVLNTAILAVVTSGLVIFSISWWFILTSYDQLNAGKFKVIHELERSLPVALFDVEWEVLGRGSEPKKYRPLTHLEKIVPFVFALLYVMLLIVRVLFSCRAF